jgi:murein DD-endopeptidase MepM/ murein hydrolase activator NlpD
LNYANPAAFSPVLPTVNPATASPDAAPPSPIPTSLSAEIFEWLPYTVLPGDSVSKIAAEHGLSYDAIIASNSLERANKLRVGQNLRLPNIDGIPYTVKKGDSLSGISAAHKVPVETILDVNELDTDIIQAGAQLFLPGARMNPGDFRAALGRTFVSPVGTVRVTSPFGWRSDPLTKHRSWHSGLDMRASWGSSVKAAADGRVSAAGWNSVYGNYVIVTHANGYQSMYGHMSKIIARQGSRVQQGDLIGRVGSTGRSTGAHLHFAMMKNGKAIDPLDFIR